LAAKLNSGDNEDLNAEINIIPLVDVMLVLLIIFMVAAPLMNDSMDVKLPQAKAQASGMQETSVILSIQKNEALFLGKTAVNRNELAIRLKQIFENREKKEIFIKADERVSHGFVIQMMAEVQRAGVLKISFLTDPEQGK
jgi:biopolymer transport protein TolR